MLCFSPLCLFGKKQTLASLVTDAELEEGSLFPSFSNVSNVSADIAAAVAQHAVESGFGKGPEGGLPRGGWCDHPGCRCCFCGADAPSDFRSWTPLHLGGGCSEHPCLSVPVCGSHAVKSRTVTSLNCDSHPRLFVSGRPMFVRSNMYHPPPVHSARL